MCDYCELSGQLQMKMSYKSYVVLFLTSGVIGLLSEVCKLQLTYSMEELQSESSVCSTVTVGKYLTWH